MAKHFSRSQEQRYHLLAGLPVDAQVRAVSLAMVRRLAEELLESESEPLARGTLIAFRQFDYLASAERDVYECQRRIVLEDSDSSRITPQGMQPRLYREKSAARRQQIAQWWADQSEQVAEAATRRRSALWEMAQELGLDPLSDFLTTEALDLETIRHTIESIALRCGSLFQSTFDALREREYGQELAEPWVDLWALFLPTAPLPTSLSPSETFRRLADGMGFATSSISIDEEARPEKAPIPTVVPVGPGDIRVAFQPLGALADLRALLHECGHALHYSCMDQTLLPPDRRPSAGAAEVHSYLLQTLLLQRDFLEGFLQCPTSAVDDALTVERFFNVRMLVHFSAAALTTIEFWTRGPLSQQVLEETYAEHLSRFTNIEFPALTARTPYPAHSQHAFTANVHSLGYPLGYARVGWLLEQLELADAPWWGNADAVQSIVTPHMRTGRNTTFPLEALSVDRWAERLSSV
ncbi:MAG: hypothetical protein KC503_25105 [Myxococcales bacterium]|nr:hypothetical protein [Myxococcales bacterium]